MVICMEQGADLHMAHLMSLPLTVSSFSKVQIGFTFLVPAHPGSPGQRAVKRACVCVFRRRSSGGGTGLQTARRRSSAVSSPLNDHGRQLLRHQCRDDWPVSIDPGQRR